VASSACGDGDGGGWDSGGGGGGGVAKKKKLMMMMVVVVVVIAALRWCFSSRRCINSHEQNRTRCHLLWVGVFQRRRLQNTHTKMMCALKNQ
jgi:hypothetical protein